MSTGNHAGFDYNFSTITGWREIPESWAYASSTTITVPTGATARYTIGDRIRYKQGGGYKYGVLFAVAATTLSITGGDDYSVANSAITNMAVSRDACPIDFPSAFNFTTSPTGFSAAPTNTVNQFMLTGKWAEVFIRQATAGTSNATTFTMTLPLTSKTLTNAVWGVVVVEAIDAGAVTSSPAVGFVNSNSSTLTLYKSAAQAAWTNSGNKAAGALTLRYPIA